MFLLSLLSISIKGRLVLSFRQSSFFSLVLSIYAGQSHCITLLQQRISVIFFSFPFLSLIFYDFLFGNNPVSTLFVWFMSACVCVWFLPNDNNNVCALND